VRVVRGTVEKGPVERGPVEKGPFEKLTAEARGAERTRLPHGQVGAGRILEHGRKPGRRRLIPWPRILDLYISRIFLVSWIVCAFSFTGIYIMVEALTKLDRFLKLGDPLWKSLPRYHAAMVPTIFTNYLGPILSTAAAVTTAVFLQRGNELEPLKASGLSTHRSFLPVFLLAGAMAGLNYYLQEAAIPKLRGPIRSAISLTHEGTLRPEPFYDLATNQLIQIREYSPAAQVGRSVVVLKRYPNGNTRERIDAMDIVWEPDPGAAGDEDRGRWVLHGGTIQRLTPAGDRIINASAKDSERLEESFTKREIETSLLPIDLETADQDIAYLSFGELKTQYRRQPDQRHLAVKLHHHLAFPLTHLILPAIAIPLVILIGTRSALLAVVASVAVCGAFYLVSSLAMSTAVHSVGFSPLLAAWLPILLFGSLGVTLMGHMRT
jgi:lipopolysaccharide export LptBFGC system permease protein LptF